MLKIAQIVILLEHMGQIFETLKIDKFSHHAVYEIKKISFVIIQNEVFVWKDKVFVYKLRCSYATLLWSC